MRWALGAVLTLLLTPALAQPAPQAEVVRQACAAEFPTVCPGVQTGGQAALQCLLGQSAKLSEACREAVAATQRLAPSPAASPPVPQAPSREDVLMMRENCGADYQKLCATVPLGGGRAINCLNQHQAQLSASCRSALAGLRR